MLMNLSACLEEVPCFLVDKKAQGRIRKQQNAVWGLECVEYSLNCITISYGVPNGAVLVHTEVRLCASAPSNLPNPFRHKIEFLCIKKIKYKLIKNDRLVLINTDRKKLKHQIRTSYEK